MRRELLRTCSDGKKGGAEGSTSGDYDGRWRGGRARAGAALWSGEDGEKEKIKWKELRPETADRVDRMSPAACFD